MRKEYNCRVCGYDNFPDELWDDDISSFLICSCCGCESGNEDCTIESIKKYRKNWIEKGMIWFNSREKPKEWDNQLQFDCISKKYL